jgi:hypothetical protein
MMRTKTAAWLRAASFALALSAAGLAPALAQSSGTVSFHDTGFDQVTVQVRVGATEDQSIPYGNHSFKKGETWSVESNLPVYWRREVNPGSGDGQFTPWQRVVPAQGGVAVELATT